MAKSAILDVNQDARRYTVYHEEDGKTFLETREDISALSKAASILSEEKPGKDFRRVGFIPDSVLNKAFTEGWFHDEAKLKQWLNDPANAHLRIWHGRV